MTPPKQTERRVKCPDCLGLGTVSVGVTHDFDTGAWESNDEITCPTCNGSGYLPTPPAPRCKRNLICILDDGHEGLCQRSGGVEVPTVAPPAERRLYAFTCGCYAVLHRDDCPVEERIEVEVVPAEQLEGLVEALDLAARDLYRAGFNDEARIARVALQPEQGES